MESFPASCQRRPTRFPPLGQWLSEFDSAPLYAPQKVGRGIPERQTSGYSSDGVRRADGSMMLQVGGPRQNAADVAGNVRPSLDRYPASGQSVARARVSRAALESIVMFPSSVRLTFRPLPRCLRWNVLTSNAFSKMAGFDSPISGRFWASTDTGEGSSSSKQVFLSENLLLTGHRLASTGNVPLP